VSDTFFIYCLRLYRCRRYGTTTYILPPYRVLNTKLLNNDPNKIKEATIAAEKPMAIVFPYDSFTSDGQTDLAAAILKTKEVIRQSGLWFSDE
jgi:hypothetical protein